MERFQAAANQTGSATSLPAAAAGTGDVTPAAAQSKAASSTTVSPKLEPEDAPLEQQVR